MDGNRYLVINLSKPIISKDQFSENWLNRSELYDCMKENKRVTDAKWYPNLTQTEKQQKTKMKRIIHRKAKSKGSFIVSWLVT